MGGGAWCKDNRRGHGWSRTLGCLERRHSGVFRAAGRRDRILILLLWQNGTMGEKTKIVGVHAFVCTCLTCASCCDWFVCTDINVIWVTWVLRERHNAREASSILSFFFVLFLAYCQIIAFPVSQCHRNTLARVLTRLMNSLVRLNWLSCYMNLTCRMQATLLLFSITLLLKTWVKRRDSGINLFDLIEEG